MEKPTSSASSKYDPSAQLRNSVPISPSIAAPARAAMVSDSPLSQSVASLHFSRPNPSAASLFASTLTPPGSRSMSPMGRGSPSRMLASSIFRSSIDSPSSSQPPDSPAHILTDAFVPHVAVYASKDTNRLAADKGFPSGLWELLRPFGERIHGKVTIRDSNGVSRSFDDFSVRFFRLGDHIEAPDPTPGAPTRHSLVNGASTLSAPPTPGLPPTRKPPWSKTVIHETEVVVDRHLTYAEQAAAGLGHLNSLLTTGPEQGSMSPYYSLYLRRLLSGISAAPHETFSHPVACIVAISSRNPDPIATLRTLYAESSKGGAQLPPWIEQEYLRYYVLVHDEEKDDIARSMSLYDQMKRHFGLHCHLLRLRGSQGAETDDDSTPLPQSNWMTADEELALLKKTDEGEDFEDPTRYIFESDATAIRTFAREMVTQSIIPTMERCVSVWNDQVASRRRGLGGRILNLSRRWGGFGGSSRSSMIGGSASTSNYDQAKGFYRPEAAEATMRKLADYAFMLRDWKLAYSTYDLLRSDYSTDKAWKFHAAANEMAAISILMNSQSISSKTRAETIDQLMEAAFYSYQTRCMATYGAVRAALICMELLRLRGGSSIDDAVRWGVRLLEGKLMGPTGEVLLKERLSVCYGSKHGLTSQFIAGRRRKSALWSILAAESWLEHGKFLQAQMCLNEARKAYSMLPNENGISKFEAASDFLAGLQQRIKEGLALPILGGGDAYVDREEGAGDDTGTESDEVEVIQGQETELPHRSRRTSIMGHPGGPSASLETAPLRGRTAGGADEGYDGSEETAALPSRQDFE